MTWDFVMAGLWLRGILTKVRHVWQAALCETDRHYSTNNITLFCKLHTAVSKTTPLVCACMVRDALILSDQYRT